LDQPEAEFYRTALGKIGYLLMTRPELCFAYSELSRFTKDPEPSHLEALQYTLGYLNNSTDLGYTIRSNPLPLKLTGYSDSDYANNIQDRKSVSGRIIFAGSSPIVWKASRQSTLATSSSHAELLALYDAASDVVYYRKVLGDLQVLDYSPSVLYCDNETTIAAIMKRRAYKVGQKKTEIQDYGTTI
jgi:hypothetical protein